MDYERAQPPICVTFPEHIESISISSPSAFEATHALPSVTSALSPRLPTSLPKVYSLAYNGTFFEIWLKYAVVQRKSEKIMVSSRSPLPIMIIYLFVTHTRSIRPWSMASTTQIMYRYFSHSPKLQALSFLDLSIDFRIIQFGTP